MCSQEPLSYVAAPVRTCCSGVCGLAPDCPPTHLSHSPSPGTWGAGLGTTAQAGHLPLLSIPPSTYPILKPRSECYAPAAHSPVAHLCHLRDLLLPLPFPGALPGSRLDANPVTPLRLLTSNGLPGDCPQSSHLCSFVCLVNPSRLQVPVLMPRPQ